MKIKKILNDWKEKYRLEKFLNYFRSNEDVFSNIYKKRKWHSIEADKEKFNSGSGSDERFALPYVKTVSDFIEKNNIKSVVDLGCGDFRVSSKIVYNNNIEYTGVDVVPDLINHLTDKYKNNKKINFLQQDIVNDKPPKGQLYLIRQVLQHLSNKEISCILKNIPIESFLIVSEHQFINRNGIIPNLDKVRGADTRLLNKSGVYLDEEPYNLKLSMLLTTNINDKECIRVFLVER